MGKFVFVSNQKNFKDTKPPHFNPTKNLHSIIDTNEIFIETTKDHKDQRLTWPCYEHHNTIEILAAAPNSSITFVCKTYSDSISDKTLNRCNYFVRIDPYCQLMVDDYTSRWIE